MRKFFLLFMLLVALAASGYGAERKILIMYFSMPERDGVDAVAGASRIVEKGVITGNVEWIAKTIQSTIGGDLCALTPTQSYPAKHAPLVDQAAAELKAGARPRLKALDANLDAYDVIFLGYPIWWADLPMPVYTFLEAHDLKGKKVIPFSSHGGSGWADTIETLTRLLPKARVIHEGFSVSRTTIAQSRQAIGAWLNTIMNSASLQ